MPARQPTIVATSIGFQLEGPDPTNLRPGPSYRLAADLAQAGEHPKVCALGHGDGRRPAPARGHPQRVRQDRLPQLASHAVPDAELPRCARPPAGPGRDLGRRRQHGQPAGPVAPARARRDPARVLGGRRGAQGCVRRLDLLAHRRDDGLVRARHFSPSPTGSASCPIRTARITTSRSNDARSSTAWSPRVRYPTAMPPRTERGSSSSAPSWPRLSPRSKGRPPTRSHGRAA